MSIRIKSIAFKMEVLEEFDMNPFVCKSPIYIPVRLILGIFVMFHFFVGLFYPNDDMGDIVQDKNGIIKIFYWLTKFFMIIIGYGLGIFLIPIQIITVPAVYIYLTTSIEKYY